MKNISGKLRKQTNKKKQQNSQSALLPPTSQSSQPCAGPPKEDSFPSTFPPQGTSLPHTKTSLSSIIHSQQNSQPPSFPLFSTSLPPSFFSIPPSGPIKNNFTTSQGRNTSLQDNIVPTPHINSSLSNRISQKVCSHQCFHHRLKLHLQNHRHVAYLGQILELIYQ